jgi:hypothetical protein
MAHATPDGSKEYCSVETAGARVEVVRPSANEPPVDDVNWFARPVPNDAGDWIIAFASHEQNYLYNLSTGRRIKIPDRSDAVATPDGRFVTVPSNYTPDQYIRFYDALDLLDHLERGVDADDVAPVFIHEHEDLRKVYYQSTGVVSQSADETVYRLMFSGTRDEAGFRIVDYAFSGSAKGGDNFSVRATEPMKLCPEIENDLNTPFISKDARYVVAYTSSSPESAYSPGSSLKLFRIAETLPAQNSTRCELVFDFGFAAGKADFSFDNSKLTFHISQGGYLTPFINGGLVAPTITDVAVMNLERNRAGEISGASGMARITTSVAGGIGNYFPAFLPDGNLFYVFNATPKDSDSEKRFSFKVVDPSAELTMANIFADDPTAALAATLGTLWQSACGGEPLKEHEAPWMLASLSASQCIQLVEDHWRESLPDKPQKPQKKDLLATCALTAKK